MVKKGKFVFHTSERVRIWKLWFREPSRICRALWLQFKLLMFKWKIESWQVFSSLVTVLLNIYKIFVYQSDHFSSLIGNHYDDEVILTQKSCTYWYLHWHKLHDRRDICVQSGIGSWNTFTMIVAWVNDMRCVVTT